MAKIVRFHSLGKADVLQIEDVALPEPKEGEVRLRVEAIGLNRAECVFRQGLYFEKPKLPSRIGYEAAGTVDVVGAGVTGLKPGDKVSTIPAFSMGQYGVYGDTAIVPARAVAHYPSNLSAQQAASIWMQYLTAYGALIEFGKIHSGDFVLLTAASSSVGHAAMQICNREGAIPIATTRGAAKKQLLLDAGAKHVIVTDEENLPKRVEEITGKKGARVIFDAVAGPFIHDLAKAAAYQGIIFEYGALSLSQTPFPLMIALQKGLSIRGYTLFELTNNDEHFERSKKYVYDGLKSGAFKPVIDRIFPLEQIVQAQEYMESNQQNGKIVVTV